MNVRIKLFDPVPPRKKIKLKLRLPKYKPEPEKPPRICKLCGTEQAGWWFYDGYHPDICSCCIFEFPRSRWATNHTDLSEPDRQAVMSAEAVIRRLSRGDQT